MYPVFQTVIDKTIGDCLRAAVASMFELDITQVPNFMMFQGSKWFDVYCYFLKGIGYEYKGTVDKSILIKDDDLINGGVIASVASRTFEGRLHSILIDSKGKVIHDPNPNKKWLGENILETGEMLNWDSIKKGGETDEME